MTQPPSPLDHLAGQVIHGTQQRLLPTITSRPALDAAERRDADELISHGNVCRFCAGLHVGANSPACPRLAGGKLNGDGAVVEFTFWPPHEWDTSRVVFPDALEDEPEKREAAP